MTFVRPLDQVTLADVAAVGAKCATLGELIAARGVIGAVVPGGFAVTTEAYRRHLVDHGLVAPLAAALAGLDPDDLDDLARRAASARALVERAPVAPALAAELAAAVAAHHGDAAVAVRSSATVEDLAAASAAGQQTSFLHVRGAAAVIDAVRRCWASAFTARAIAYRRAHGLPDEAVAVGVVVQAMVAADRGAAGVAFSLDPETGFPDVVLVSSAWGLGDAVVGGRVRPDELYVHKPTGAVVWRRVGAKEVRCVEARGGGLRDEPVPLEDRRRASLPDDAARTLAGWTTAIEAHLSARAGAPTPVEVEWARDAGGALHVVQARPATGRAARAPALRLDRLLGHAAAIAHGTSVGAGIGIGRARVVTSSAQLDQVERGDVVVTTLADPDWTPVLRRVAAIVAERGGRTSHAAVVARELDVPAVVGVEGALRRVPDGEIVTVSCAEGDVGRIYRGAQPFEPLELDAATLAAVPSTRTRVEMSLGRPDRAFRLARLPCDGIGLARIEYVLTTWVGLHPLAVVHYDRLPLELRGPIDARLDGRTDRAEVFVDRLAQGLAVLAAAMWPRPVRMRFSDFTSAEFARLPGGLPFEPLEPNPLLGWRGATRYLDPECREAFALECAAVRRVRELGLTNLHVMLPFCRTPDDAARVLELAAVAGLPRGGGGPSWHLLAELPSNALLADRFAELFDGFTIGLTDLTQLVLGVDREAARVATSFDERDPAVRRACGLVIDAARARGLPVALVGQAPLDDPALARWLVERGVDAISVAPDSVIPLRRQLAAIEAGGA